jgi:transposase
MNLSHYDQQKLFGADMIYSEMLTPDDICYTIKNEIAPLISNTDFGEMYKEGGRPPVPPKILLLVTIMQYLEKLSDRAAAMNLRFRIDWKIAFGLEIDDMGIHSTTLHYFRERLLENEKASLAFDKVLEHLVSVGLVKKKQKQRIDSTHIIANVRELSRLELFTETLRLFCVDIKLIQHLLDEQLLNNFNLYIEKFSIRGLSDAIRNELIKKAGEAMVIFIEWGKGLEKEAWVKNIKSYQTLNTVFEQNFKSESESESEVELIKVSTGKDHICSPHETDAEYANKGGKGWLGYKAQVVETINENKDKINFITHIEATDANDFDGDEVVPIINNLESKEIAPSDLYGDTHYNTKDNIETLNDSMIKTELKGPVAPRPTKKTQKKNKGFEYSKENVTVRCPLKIESKKCVSRKDGKIFASFPQAECHICSHKKVCLPEKRGKQIAFRPENDILARRREKMKTDEFKIDMHKRNGVEGTISGLVRGQGMRRIRYKGKSKAELQIKFCGAAANISRLHRQREIQRDNFMNKSITKMLKSA